jgi:hypothetical protein
VPSRRLHELVDVLCALDAVEYDGASHGIRWVAPWPPTETYPDPSTQAAAAEEAEGELQAEMARLQARREWLEVGVRRCEVAIAKVTRPCALATCQPFPSPDGMHAARAQVHMHSRLGLGQCPLSCRHLHMFTQSPVVDLCVDASTYVAQGSLSTLTHRECRIR